MRRENGFVVKINDVNEFNRVYFHVFLSPFLYYYLESKHMKPLNYFFSMHFIDIEF